ncbi:MAG: Na/Pi symporter [Acidobacteriota bacterium]|nr:Na/Pi symporter [Acidobacteriota bacterium]
MTKIASHPPAPASSSPLATLSRVVTVMGLLLVFLVGVKCLGGGFKMLGHDVLDSFFAATSNPFIALMVGILATTLVQSSSVTTAMIVGLVAAPDNPLPIANAVPMIMGANIGTTVTNTIVSMAHMGRPEEFRRAFSVATCHDFFNYMIVVTLLPLELMTGFLRRSATGLADLLGDISGVKYESPLKSLLKKLVAPIKDGAAALSDAEQIQGIIIILVSAVLIFVSLWLLVRTLRAVLQTRVEVSLNRVLGSSIVLSVIVGIIVTVMVQSSSITTSLLVPLAGAGVITARQAFPITVGANIGTTVTALLASMAVSGENAEAGIIIALVHLGFNLSGTFLVLPFPRIRAIPVRFSTMLAESAVRSKKWPIFYVIMLFYILPAIFAFLFR